MNQKIKKLLLHAGIYDGREGIYWCDESNLEKFAESIVRECMNICKEHPSRTLSNNWNAYAVAPDIVHIFEEHFGVEE